MYYIDDISSNPWTTEAQRKYQLYSAFRKERDKFLKSLREMSYIEWSIDKRLIEAGGIGKTVYILPARGGSRFPYEAIRRYAEEGKDVRLATLHVARGNGKWRTLDKMLDSQEEAMALTLKQYKTPTLSSKDIETIRESIRQFELYSKLVTPWRDPKYETLFNDYYPYEVEPSYTMDQYGNIHFRDISLVRREERHE